MKEAAEVAAMQIKSSAAATLSAALTYIASLGGLFVSSVEWINQNDKFCLVAIASTSLLMQTYFRWKDHIIVCRSHDRRRISTRSGE